MPDAPCKTKATGVLTIFHVDEVDKQKLRTLASESPLFVSVEWEKNGKNTPDFWQSPSTTKTKQPNEGNI